ncbi:MAG TPA: hypothetical protein VGC28_07435 [Sphingomonas sp.]
MIEASRTLALPSLSATLVRRRKPLLLAPPPHRAAMPAEMTDEAAPRWTTWREDLRFFAGCYAAGLVFFIIMLS